MNKSTTTPTVSPLSASGLSDTLLYEIYSDKARVYAEHRAYCISRGWAEPAVLAGQRQIFYEDLAKQFAPKPETWCVASLRALRSHGPSYIASGVRYKTFARRISL